MRKQSGKSMERGPGAKIFGRAKRPGSTDLCVRISCAFFATALRARGSCGPMKNRFLTLTLTGAVVLAAPTFTRAEDAKPEPAKGAGVRGGRFNPEERLKQMTETLTLTQEQQDKIKAILEKNKGVREELAKLSPEERRAKAGEMMKSQIEEIGAVLTAEQKEKWKAEMEKRRAERGGAKPGEAK